MKVIIVIPTADGKVEQKCLEAAQAQTYPCSIHIEICKPKKKYLDPQRNKSFNTTRTKNQARKKMLRQKSDFFLFLDSDVVLPPDAVKSFLMQEQFPIQGGWYKIIGSKFYAAGLWIAKNTFQNFEHVHHSVIGTHMVGIGCMFISKSALIKLPFYSGITEYARRADGSTMYVGCSLKYGMGAAKKKIRMVMNGDVVCEHLVRERSLIYA